MMDTRLETAQKEVELASSIFEKAWIGSDKGDRDETARDLAYCLHELRVAKSLEKEMKEERAIQIKLECTN